MKGKKLLRTVVALVALAEALAFFVGTALHLGVPLPVPYGESERLSVALVEAAGGALLLIAAAAILTHRRQAWQIAVAAHVGGVVAITYGITRGGGVAMLPSHHRPMLLFLIVALVALATPPIRNVLENGRRRRKQRRHRRHRKHRPRVMQSL